MYLPSNPHLRSRRGSGVAALLCAFFLIAPQEARARPEAYAVVVSRDVDVSDLSLQELREILTFKKRYWSAGHPINVLFCPSNLNPGSYILENIYRLEYSELRRLILEKLYSGELDLAPKVVSSEQEVVGFVASGTGLLGLVPAESVEDRSVKVLSIDGKKPGARGYALER